MSGDARAGGQSFVRIRADGHRHPGAPNANFHKGTVENPANLWKFREGDPNPDESRRLFPLADDIGRCFGGVKVLVTNDANAATIGEMIYGNAKGMRDFIMITLGTGLGSGFVANGEMIYGHDGFAGEFGHVIVERDGPRVRLRAGRAAWRPMFRLRVSSVRHSN